jgi:hypothetical protein
LGNGTDCKSATAGDLIFNPINPSAGAALKHGDFFRNKKKMEVIKKIVSQKSFMEYNIPDSFGNKAEIIILPCHNSANLASEDESIYLMKVQEQNGSVIMLNDPKEDAWDKI